MNEHGELPAVTTKNEPGGFRNLRTLAYPSEKL